MRERRQKQKPLRRVVTSPAGGFGQQLEQAARYAIGDGIPKNEKKAAELYTVAASQGSAEATYNLATMYARGEGVRASWSRAMALYKRAEKLGSGDASIALGELALQSEGNQEAARLEALRHFAHGIANRDLRGFLRMAEIIDTYDEIDKHAIVGALLSACAGKGSKEAKAMLKTLAGTRS